MNNNTLIKLLLGSLFSVIIILTALIFWLFGSNAAPNIDSPIAFDSQQPQPADKEEAPLTLESAYPAPTEQADTSTVPDTNEVATNNIKKQDPIAHKRKTNKPHTNYFYHIDPAKIKRNPAYATFLLLDRRSKFISSKATIQVLLWRDINGYTLQEGAYFDREKSAIICSGTDKQGLENGLYRLEVFSDEYGELQHTFQVKALQAEVKDILYLPFYRKVITFHFLDGQHKPVKHLPLLPEYHPRIPKRSSYGSHLYTDSIFIHQKKRTRPRKRKWPTPPSGLSAKSPEMKHLTNEGVLHFEVYVGNKAQLKIPFKNKGQYLLNITSKFEGEQWESYEVNIHDNQEFLQTVSARKKTANQDDPGYQSLKSPIKLFIPTETIIAIPTKATSDQALTIFTARSNTRLSLRYRKNRSPKTYITIKPQGEDILLNLTKTNLSSTKYINIAFTDEKFFLSRWQMHTPVYGSIKYYPTSFFLVPIKFELKATPTLIEMLMNRATVKGKSLSFNFEKIKNKLVVNSFLDLNDMPDISDYNDLELHFEKYATFSSFAKEKFIVTPKHFKKIKKGPYTFKNPIKGIVLKVINQDNNAGLPWVEAAVFPLEQEEDILDKVELFDVKQKNKTRSALNIYANPLDSSATWRYRRKIKLSDKTKAIKLAKELIPYFTSKALKKEMPEVIRSDEKGYMFIHRDNIIPGKNYVLYLYSSSKRISSPDKIVPFTAKEGVTDLGAIQVPTYR